MTQVALNYRLTAEGRKAALLAGEPAREFNSRQVEIADLAQYADVLSVSDSGVAEISATQVCLADPRGYSDLIEHIAFDATPSAEKCAAAIRAARAKLDVKSSELSASLEAEKTAAAEKAAEREATYSAFLADPTAIVDSAWLTVGRGRFKWRGIDECYDESIPAHVEASRRHAAIVVADEAARKARAAARDAWLRDFLAQQAPEMLRRYDAGLLAADELLERVTDWSFAAIDAPRYERLEADDVECECGTYADVKFHSSPASSATAEEFAALEAIRGLVAACDRLQDADVTLRTHVAECECGAKATRAGIMVIATAGPFEVHREVSCA